MIVVLALFVVSALFLCVPYIVLILIDSSITLIPEDIHLISFILLLSTSAFNPIAFGSFSRELRLVVHRFIWPPQNNLDYVVTDFDCKINYENIEQEFKAMAVDENGLYCPSPSIDVLKQRISDVTSSQKTKLEKEKRRKFAKGDKEVKAKTRTEKMSFFRRRSQKLKKEEISALENGVKLSFDSIDSDGKEQFSPGGISSKTQISYFNSPSID